MQLHNFSGQYLPRSITDSWTPETMVQIIRSWGYSVEQTQQTSRSAMVVDTPHYRVYFNGYVMGRGEPSNV
jgi:hypothetical protein